MRALLAMGCAVLLVACDSVPPMPRVIETGCGAEGLQPLVGQPQSVLAAMTFAAPTRVITPGTAVTMDHRPDRLNIEVGADGRIARVYCG